MVNISNILYLIPGAIIACTIHEYIKALISSKLGDPLPKARMRVTLNPLAHLEPIGFICMIVLGYGWGKPVETSPLYYADRKKGTMLTYIVPSLINILVGLFFIIAYNAIMPFVRTMVYDSGDLSMTSLKTSMIMLNCIYHAAYLNISMAFFNIIPVYPLDGAKILALYISPNAQLKMTVYEKIFQIILIFLLMTGVVNMLLGPLTNIFMHMMARF